MQLTDNPSAIAYAIDDPGVRNLSLIRARGGGTNYDRAAPLFSERLEAEYIGGGFLKVRLRATPANEAATLLNAYLQAFEEQINEQVDQDREERLLGLNLSASEASAELAHLRDRLERLAESSTDTEFERQRCEAVSARKVELTEREARLEYLERRYVEPKGEPAIRDQTGNQPEIERMEALKAEIEELQMVVDRLEEAEVETRTVAENLVERQAIGREIESWERRAEEVEERVFWLEATRRHPPQVTIYYGAQPPPEEWPERLLRWLGL